MVIAFIFYLYLCMNSCTSVSTSDSNTSTITSTVSTIFPDYVPCPTSLTAGKTPADVRRFYLSTFKTGNDTAPDFKFYLEGQGFNSSSTASSGGLQAIQIAGKELKFWKKRFFYHPYSSLQFVRDAIQKEVALGNDPHKAFSMHVDYDTVLTGILIYLWVLYV